MNSETRQCQNCKGDFIIAPDDFVYYENLKVPPPTWCPECRMVRRLFWRNEKTLYKRKCDAPGHTEDLITVFHPEAPFKAYDHDYWFSDNWDPTSYGVSYDFSKPFFVQFKNLLEQVPQLALSDEKSVDSNYCNLTVEHKNCYMVSAAWNNEDCFYLNRTSFCKDTADSFVCHKTDFSYENVRCKESYKLFWSLDSENCNDSYFLYDCKNCSNCIGCANLRNKSYCIFNQQYAKLDYEKKKAEMRLGTREGIEALSKQFETIYNKAIHKYAYLINTVNVIGDNVEKSKNCYCCFDLAGGAENVKYTHWGTYGLKDSYDTGPGTGGNSELTYEGMSIGVTNSRCAFGAIIWYSNDVYYSFNCHGCRNVFGCSNLRNKEYCILNKKYTKEEYQALVPKIIAHMNEMPYVDKKGRIFKYGEFLPQDISPFAYNETVAQDYFPLTKDEADKAGYFWRNEEKKNYTTNISAKDLPQDIGDVKDDILQKVIKCGHEGGCNHRCSGAFKITQQELQFYRKLNLPLPALCFNCRHARRLALKNPMKLWHRKCMNKGCQNEFETTFSPDRPEIVYCEGCYQSEVI